MRWLVIAFLAVFAFAGGHGASAESHTDIIPRTINFLIFAAILWYLVGEKVINFFNERREKIAKEFQAIEEKLKESKAKKEALRAELEEAKRLAQDIVETAKKEAELIEQKIKAQVDEEIALLQKNFEEYKKAEIRKNKEAAVRAFMSEVLKDIHISSEDAAKLVLKVA